MKESTPYFRRLAACVGKEPFATPQLARKVLRRRSDKPKHRKARARKVFHADSHVYHCPHCSMFHIGTETKSVHASLKRARRWEAQGDDMA